MPPNTLPPARSVSVDGLTIPVRKLGDGDNVPAVLVHGFGSDLNTWAQQHPELAADRPTFAFDLPGHGQASLHVPEDGLPGYAVFLTRLLDRLELNEAHLVGISMGGAVCLKAALDHLARPVSRVRSITCINAAGFDEWVNHSAGEAYFQAQDRDSLRQALTPYMHRPDLVSDAALDAVLERKARPGMVEGLRAVRDRVFDGARQRCVLKPRLGELSCPLQIIWGASDGILPVSQVEDLADRFPVHILKHAGHNPLYEAPEKVSLLLKRFFHHADGLS